MRRTSGQGPSFRDEGPFSVCGAVCPGALSEGDNSSAFPRF